VPEELIWQRSLNFTAISIDYQPYTDKDEPDGSPVRGYYDITDSKVNKWC
jgi:hypothetical protein